MIARVLGAVAILGAGGYMFATQSNSAPVTTPTTAAVAMATSQPTPIVLSPPLPVQSTPTPTAVPAPSATPQPVMPPPMVTPAPRTVCQPGWTASYGDCYPPGSTDLWTPQDCHWAIHVMTWDRDLDQQAEPRDEPYYTMVVGWWNVTLALLHERCDPPNPDAITASEAGEVRSWVTIAVGTHWSNSAWDVQWRDYYYRLTGMFLDVPR